LSCPQPKLSELQPKITTSRPALQQYLCCAFALRQRLAFVCWLCVPCTLCKVGFLSGSCALQCAKNCVGQRQQSHEFLYMCRMLNRVTHNGTAWMWRHLKFVSVTDAKFINKSSLFILLPDVTCLPAGSLAGTEAQ